MKATTQHTRQKKNVDLVMEGGGIKGAGLIGAVETLYNSGYRFPRIAGASAGAIVGALLAAGMSPAEVRRLLIKLNFKQLQDPTLFSRLGLPGKATSVILTRGIYKGDTLHEWLRKYLTEQGVHTFRDLRITEDWAKVLPPEQRYKLVVMVADISRGRLLRLPWDYHLLGRDPDSQSVADAVRASASIPFFYQPVKVGRTLLVDGGLLSNFPVDIFDQYSTPITWPTFGVKLSSRNKANTIRHKTQGVFSFSMALLYTLINAYDHEHLDDPATTSRTIFIDADKVRATNFELKRKEREALRASGEKAAKKFLESWDYARYFSTFIQPQLDAAAQIAIQLDHKKKATKE